MGGICDRHLHLSRRLERLRRHRAGAVRSVKGVFMKYMGSKSRIAKDIVPIIQKYIDSNETDKYFEPFVGGANIIDKINSSHKYASDLNPYLIALLKHVQSGGALYSEVSKGLYDKARAAYNAGDTSDFEDWQIGNIGFIASYNGRWFDGGYAKPGFEKTKYGLRYRDYYREAYNNIMKQAPMLKGIIFNTCNYENAHPKGCVVYCDPPYSGMKQYANAKEFDYNKFWDTMRCWSKDNIVIVSEQSAPDDWNVIWQQTVKRSIKANDKKDATEKLYMMIEE